MNPFRIVYNWWLRRQNIKQLRKMQEQARIFDLGRMCEAMEREHRSR